MGSTELIKLQTAQNGPNQYHDPTPDLLGHQSHALSLKDHRPLDQKSKAHSCILQLTTPNNNRPKKKNSKKIYNNSHFLFIYLFL